MTKIYHQKTQLRTQDSTEAEAIDRKFRGIDEASSTMHVRIRTTDDPFDRPDEVLSALNAGKYSIMQRIRGDY